MAPLSTTSANIDEWSSPQQRCGSEKIRKDGSRECTPALTETPSSSAASSSQHPSRDSTTSANIDEWSSPQRRCGSEKIRKDGSVGCTPALTETPSSSSSASSSSSQHPSRDDPLASSSHDDSDRGATVLDAMLLQESDPSYRVVDYLSLAASENDETAARASGAGAGADGPGVVPPPPLLDETSRAKMAEWALAIADYCSFSVGTALAATSYVDRYLSLPPSDVRGGRALRLRALRDRRRYQLLYMTALQVSVKVYEREDLDGALLSQLSQGSYSASEFAETERDLLDALGWRLCGPTAAEFVPALLSAAAATCRHRDDEEVDDGRTTAAEFVPALLSAAYGMCRPRDDEEVDDGRIPEERHIEDAAARRIRAAVGDYNLAWRTRPSILAAAAVLDAMDDLCVEDDGDDDDDEAGRLRGLPFLSRQRREQFERALKEVLVGSRAESGAAAAADVAEEVRRVWAMLNGGGDDDERRQEPAGQRRRRRSLSGEGEGESPGPTEPSSSLRRKEGERADGDGDAAASAKSDGPSAERSSSTKAERKISKKDAGGDADDERSPVCVSRHPAKNGGDGEKEAEAEAEEEEILPAEILDVKPRGGGCADEDADVRRLSLSASFCAVLSQTLKIGSFLVTVQ
eukprot:CAMPEP_0197465536 /NCGR_PEP_ID=MMETSP1175-20131217/64589_1 /TAXON_ID=1003142 /ORGANISM="Triceratium dubium, Strain CCMP147" /LENGTH=634 /DNA_ID=CAMNT_0043001553 /DNA_START=401 /DNA_END=2305 /DNA_ORIENTATION=-